MQAIFSHSRRRQALSRQRLALRIVVGVPLALISGGIVVAVAVACGARDSAGPPTSGSVVTAPPPSPAAPAAGAGSARTAPGSNEGASAQLPSAPPIDAPRAAAGSGEPPAAEPQRPVPGCEDANIDDLITQAQNQYTAGFAEAALQLAVKALQCRQDVRLYRFAVLYACAAHDAASAKRFFAKVSPAVQPAIIQRCQQENITVP